MPIQADAGYSLYIKTSAGEKKFPVLRDGFTLKLTAGAGGKHSSSSCQISTRGADVLQTIMYATGLVDAWIEDDAGNTVFTGVIRPYASITASPMHLGNLSLEILDYTEKLHKKVYAKPDSNDTWIEESDVVFEDKWNNLKICDPDNPGSSIVHKLCGECGITDIDAPKIDVTIHRFSLKSGDYLDDVLGALLYEYIYDYRFDENGKMHVYQTGTIIEVSFDENGDVIEGSTVYHRLSSDKTVTVFRNSLRISRDDEKVDGAIVKYNKYKTVYNVPIGSHSESGGTGLISGQISLSQSSYKLKWDLSEIEDDNGEEPELSNFWVNGYNNSDWAATCGSYNTYLTETTQEDGVLNFQIWYFGGLWGTWRYTMDVYADVTYYRSESRTVGYAGENAEEYSARYIEAIEHAMCLAASIRERSTKGVFTYSFDSFEKLKPGDVVTLDEKDISGVETKARITKRTQKDETGLYSYEAEGYEDANFRIPEVDRDEDPDKPWEQPNFILLSVSDDTIIPEEEDSTPIYAEASGMLFNRYGATPQWYLNGVLMTGFSSLNIQFSKQMLASGANSLRVTGLYDGETYYAERIINYIGVDLDIQMQFAAIPSGESPDSSTVWQDTQPTPGAGEVIWMRFKTSSSSDWIVMKMTAEDGGNPIVFFQWAATPYIKPDDAFELLTWGDMAITWETDDETIGFIVDSGRWESLVPDKPFGLNYLWVKYWNYQENQWDYFCTTGTPAMDFNLIVNPQTYKLTSRGVTQESKDCNDRCQRINVRCQRLNTTAPISWELTPNDETLFTWERVDDADDSEIVIIINPKVALPTINIHCSIADIDTAKDFVISGIQEGKAEIIYAGIIPSTSAFPNDTSEGPLMVGDHVLVEDSSGNRTPYYWNGSAWVMSDANTPIDVSWQILANVLYDATHSPGTISSQSIVNLFAQNFAAYTAFIYNLMVRNLRVGAGSTSSGFRFDVYDYQNGSRVTPVIRARYNGNTIFQIVPSSGRVFFGQPNSELTAPLTGFMFDPVSEEIRSASGRFRIDSNGYLHATGAQISGSGSFTGSVTATSGTFSGDIKCRNFEVSEGTESMEATLETNNKTINQIYYLLDALNAAVNDWNMLPSVDKSYELIDVTSFNGRIFQVNSSSIPGAAYIVFQGVEEGFENQEGAPRILFYDNNREPLMLKAAGLDLQIVNESGYSDTNALGLSSKDYFMTRGTYLNEDSVEIDFVLDFGDTMMASLPVIPASEESNDANMNRPYGQLYVTDEGFVKMRLR